MIRYALVSVLILFVDNLSASDIVVEKPNKLFQLLQSNEGWDLINKDGDIAISTKSIRDMNLAAYMVKKKTTIPSDIIQDIVMDVRNYDEYFNKNQSFVFRQLNKGHDWVEGHHYLPINIPLIKDREYFFRVHSNGYSLVDTTSIVHWYLTKSAENKGAELNRDTIYLDYGAGLWMAEYLNKNNYILSYRLYIDPGGSIPDFAIELMNKANIMNIFQNVIAEASSRIADDIP
ncbi:MAG: hypothetical protein ACJZ12_00130 [Candidatus Neomarinimicrobiota bacterium]